MARQPENIADGFDSLIGGMNSGIAATLLPENQYALAINTTTRGGYIRTRPKFRRIAVDFGSQTDGEAYYKTNAITGYEVYNGLNGAESVLCCSGGRFFAFTINGNSAIFSEFTPSDQRNSQYQPITWFQQSAEYMVCQNGLDKPVIYDGATGRRSDIANNQVPVGRQMAFINGRLALALTDGREIAFGDLAYETATSAITFTEILLPASEGGQALGLPLNVGQITGMIATAQMNTIAGQGTLLVATNTAITSINPIVQRNLWATLPNLQSIALIGNGFATDGLATVNGDVWGRSVDGYRSFVMAQRDFYTWGNTPQSREVQRLIDFDSRNLLTFSNAIYFDNRLLMTVSPQSIGGLGTYHNGIIALNFDNISGLTTKSTPAYDGLWTGVKPYGFCQGNFNGVQRCFMFCYFPDTGTNELWEVTTEYGDDNDIDRIECSLETRSFTFQTKAISKSLQMAEVYLDQVVGTVDMSLNYKPNQYPCWNPWKDWTVCAAKPSCNPQGQVGDACVQPIFQVPQYRSAMQIGPPPNSCDPVTKMMLSRGYEFQVKLNWTGQAQIRNLILWANKQPENNFVVGC